MKRLVAGVVGGIVTLGALVGASGAGQQTLTAFLLALGGVFLGLFAFWLIRARHGHAWRWYHTIGVSTAGSFVALVATVALFNPEDSGALGFAMGSGLGWGVILGLCAALLVYGFGLSRTQTSAPEEGEQA